MQRFIKRLAAAAVMTTLLATGATSLKAESTYGCIDLDGFQYMPSLEGLDGVFFRIFPELRNFHAFSDETVEDMARLSEVLRARGTTLVYAPIPPKSMVMTEHLPRRAFDYGFDPQLATTVYDDMVRRLREAGVVTANVRKGLVVGARGGEPYFKTDYRLNALGAQLVAQTVATALSGVDENSVMFGVGSQPSGQVEIKSPMRDILQRHCSLELPRASTSTYDAAMMTAARNGFDNPVLQRGRQATVTSNPRTSSSRPAFDGSGSALSNESTFGSRQTAGSALITSENFGRSPVLTQRREIPVPRPGIGGNLVLVGTEYTATQEAGMAAAMQAYTGMSVTTYALEDGGAYGGISSYLTNGGSDASVLVWENPVYNNLAQFGDQPMSELIASSNGSCSITIPLNMAAGSTTATADLGRINQGNANTLFLDTDGADAKEVKFTFTGNNGFERTKFVTRRSETARSSRFFVTLTGLWIDGVRSVSIQSDVALGAAPRLTACTN